MSVDPRIGSTLAGYRIERLLGRGGMSVVYLAEDTRLERPVALKLIAPELAEDEQFRDRFLWESRLAASLDHPNVIPIYEAGEADGQLFIAMRYVDGTDLRKLLDEENKLSPRRSLALLEQVASALDEAHKSGLIHRDVKPGNILIGSHEHVYLSDFGITKRAEAGESLTESGQLLGTIDYVAPEQVQGAEIDGRADQYALASVLYEALTGRVPYSSKSASKLAVLFSHMNDPPPRLSDARPELPAAADATLAQAMAKDPGDRFSTCREATTTLQHDLGLTGAMAVAATPVKRRRRRILVVGAIVALLAAAGVAAALALTIGGGDGAPAELAAGTLVRIDPATNEVADSIELDHAPNSIASGSLDIWVTHFADGSMSQFDTTGNFVRKISLGAAPFDVADHGGRSASSTGARVVTAGGLIKEIDARSGGIFEDPGTFASAVAGNASGIWIATLDGVARLSTSATPGPLDPVAVPTDVTEFPPFTGISLGTSTAWLIGDTFAPKLWRVDLDEHVVAATIDLPSVAHSVATAEDAVWVTSLLDDVVWRVDTTTDEIVTTIPVGRGAAGIAVDESGVWVANSLDGTVTRIDPRTNAVVETIEVGGRPVDITIGPMGIWVAAAQTPGAPAPDEGAIRIGVIRDCYGFIGFASDTSLAGVLLPLVRRGGESRCPTSSEQTVTAHRAWPVWACMHSTISAGVRQPS